METTPDTRGGAISEGQVKGLEPGMGSWSDRKEESQKSVTGQGILETEIADNY